MRVVLYQQQKMIKQRPRRREREQNYLQGKHKKFFNNYSPLIEEDLWEDSVVLLSQITNDREGIYSGTDRATAWYYFGYVYFSQEKFKKAIKAYQSLIDEPEGDYRQKNNALYSLSQLAYIQEDYKTSR